jgi:hypothetical protein
MMQPSTQTGFGGEAVYPNCLRCGRDLSATKSTHRGYGDVCWSKIVHRIDKGLDGDKDMPRTVEDRERAVYSWGEVIDALRQASKRGEIRKKCHCGEPFDWTELDGFDCEPEATDGYRLKGFKYPLWLYIHCDKCGHDTALWKLGNPGLLAAIKTAAPELVA